MGLERALKIDVLVSTHIQFPQKSLRKIVKVHSGYCNLNLRGMYINQPFYSVSKEWVSVPSVPARVYDKNNATASYSLLTKTICT